MVVLGRLFSWLGRVMCVNTVVKALVRSPPNIPCEPELVSQATPELVSHRGLGLCGLSVRKTKPPVTCLPSSVGHRSLSCVASLVTSLRVFATQLVTSEDRAQSMTPVEERYRYVLSSYLCFYYSRLNCGPWGE